VNIKSGTAVLLSTGIVISGIILTSALGLWTTQSTKTPKKLSTEQSSSQSPAQSSGELVYDPEGIKGSYTFLEISNLYKIPLKDLASAFSVDENAAKDFKCKDLESIYADASKEIGTASVRMFVSFYYGRDYLSVEEVYLPATALDVLKQHSKATPAQLAFLETRSVPAS